MSAVDESTRAATRRCTRCLETHPLSEFPAQKRGGVGPWCRTCRAEWSRDYYVRRGKLRRHLREVIDRNGRSVSRSATGSMPSGSPECVCGHGEYFHQRGKRRACSCGSCPEWMERGT